MFGVDNKLLRQPMWLGLLVNAVNTDMCSDCWSKPNIIKHIGGRLLVLLLVLVLVLMLVLVLLQ